MNLLKLQCFDTIIIQSNLYDYLNRKMEQIFVFNKSCKFLCTFNSDFIMKNMEY